ncbi:MAG: DUF1877 family protein [Thermosynechococcus sp. Uc]|uniref:DUF1877 family protein n=1 Tax=Thermosynechococcus sp. Uc TaxID=3034853 RepID=UPI00259E3014|nr:DUF1877 family protein [Thermosynechococcus sp. Uc]MDM7326043.1 DUF1877 family protein [Thermosynechococcus sp. Uc]
MTAIPHREPLEDLEALIAAAEEGIAAGHGLHWLLTGAADGGNEPWCYLRKRGREITTKDLVDSALRFRDRHQANAGHSTLQSVTETALAQRFDPEAMAAAHIYSPLLWRRSDPEPWQSHTNLRDF